MLPTWTVIGFSGHRALTQPAAVAEKIGAVLDELAAQYGPLVAASSIARGSDTLFAEAVVQRQIPWWLVLPFPADRFQRDFSPDDWKRVTPLFAKARRTEQIEPCSSDNESYMQTGVRLVDQADIMFVVWDGQPSRGFGGTGDVVAYARAIGKPLTWIDPNTGAVSSERLESLAQNHTPADWRGDPRQAVEDHFRALDRSASLRAPSVRHLLQRVVLLHLVAAAVAMSAVILDIHGFAAYATALFEVIVLSAAFLLTAMRHRRHMQWMKARIEAEICRSSLATWPMRARVAQRVTFAITGFEKTLRDLRLLQLMDPAEPPPLETARDDYLNGRIHDQLDYFQRRCRHSARAYQRLKWLALSCTVAAAAMATAHFALELTGREGLGARITVLLSLVLPLASAAIFSLILTHEYSRRAYRYQEMVELLQSAAHELAAVRTWSGLACVAGQTEDLLLNEAAEWQSFRRFAAEPH